MDIRNKAAIIAESVERDVHANHNSMTSNQVVVLQGFIAQSRQFAHASPDSEGYFNDDSRALDKDVPPVPENKHEPEPEPEHIDN